MSCGTLSSDDHPINIKGFKRAVAFRQDVGHGECEGFPDHKHSGSAFADRPGSPANADECEYHSSRRGERRPLRESGQANRTVKWTLLGAIRDKIGIKP
jgi:hypothetical protein